jgi:hypothetical protein
MPDKQVSQATFDAVVREAMSDFDMSPEEALAEAKSQLALAGVVDFSNILTSLPSSASASHPAFALLEALDAATPAAPAALAALAAAARTDPETRGIAAARGALSTVAVALDSSPAEAADCIAALCAGAEINRAALLALADGLPALKRAVVRVSRADDSCKHAATVAVLRALIVVVDKSEDAKVAFVSGGETLDAVLRVLHNSTSENNTSRTNVIRACCAVFRSLLSADDMSKNMSEVFNRARVVCGSLSVMESGLMPLGKGVPSLPVSLAHIIVLFMKLEGAPPLQVVVDCLIVSRLCAVSDEICGAMAELGFVDNAFALLAPSDGGKAHLVVARACLSLLRSLAARDDIKAVICAQMSTVSAVAAEHEADAGLCERYLGLVGTLCLRRPDLAADMAKNHNAVAAIISAMRIHADVVGLQLSGCFTLRNLFVRNEYQARRIREDGKAEAVLRAARKRFPVACGDAAYTALSDLNVLEDNEIRRDRRYTTPF